MSVSLIIVLYIGLLFTISFVTSKENNNSNFFVGNRNSSWWAVALGMVGASVSGVTFVSVPGWISSTHFTYLQMAAGFIFGYFLIAYILLPLYYKKNATSIYSILEEKLGKRGRTTAAFCFFLTKLLSSAVKLYVVVLILHHILQSEWGIPFPLLVFISILTVWFYSFRSGIKTIVWTDFIQTIFLILSLLLLLYTACNLLNYDISTAYQTIKGSEYSTIFNFDWSSKQNFFKQFVSGIFIVLVMTGMDQDMMQKNLSCKNLKEAQKNMISYSFLFIPLNLLLLSLGVLITVYFKANGIEGITGDHLLPSFAQQSGNIAFSCFLIGLIASTFSSIDSAMTSITTTISVDFLGKEPSKKRRMLIHASVGLLFFFIVLGVEKIRSEHAIDIIYSLVSYLYGPVLGLFGYALSNQKQKTGKSIFLIAIGSILLSHIISVALKGCGYTMGYELLLLNGLFMWIGLKLLPNK